MLLDEWRSAPLTVPPYFLPGDHDLLRAQGAFEDTNPQVTTGSNRGGARIEERFQLGLLPIPFQGDIRNAVVYLLMINPASRGTTEELEAESRPEWRMHLMQNIRQEADREFPFFSLNPDYPLGYSYWYPRLRWLVSAYELSGMSRTDALKQVSKLFCAVEIVPYFSRRAPSIFLSNDPPSQLHSSRLVINHVVNEVLPRANAGQALVVVGRKTGLWGLPRDARNVFPNSDVPNAVVPRSGHFILELRHIVLDWLRGRGFLSHSS